MPRWTWFLLAPLGSLVVLGGAVLFLFGGTLFGSSRATIDDYNEDALRRTPLPPGARLVAWRIYEQQEADGTLIRYREHVYVTTLSVDEVQAFYRGHPPPRERGVAFAVLPPWQKPPPGGYTIVAAPAEGETTTFGLRAGQRVVRGRLQGAAQDQYKGRRIPYFPRWSSSLPSLPSSMHPADAGRHPAEDRQWQRHRNSTRSASTPSSANR